MWDIVIHSHKSIILTLSHTLLLDGRFSSIAVPVRATWGVFNPDFQEILDEFQIVYNRHAAECAANSRRLGVEYYNETWVDAYSEDSLKLHPDYVAYNLTGRRLQGGLAFDPYSDLLMPDIFFFRYDGSISEPPCLAITW